MKALDELREFIETHLYLGATALGGWKEAAFAIADRIDAEHQKALGEWKAENGQMWLKGEMECHAEMMEGNEVIAADLERAGWVMGPLDADGEMWHSGDRSDSNWGVIEGVAYEGGRWLVRGHDTSAPWIPADSIRHYHPPTIEGILRDFGVDVAHALDADPDATVPETIIAEYAQKLRLVEEDV